MFNKKQSKKFPWGKPPRRTNKKKLLSGIAVGFASFVGGAKLLKRGTER